MTEKNKESATTPSTEPVMSAPEQTTQNVNDATEKETEKNQQKKKLK